MKKNSSMAIALSALALLLVFGWLAGGCASSSDGSSEPKPGSGIAEYRKVAREAHRSVSAVVDSLAALPRASAPSPADPSLAGFDRALGQLEGTSVKARARAEAIIARGQSYFDEWKGNIAGITNQAAVRVETERYARLFDHFGRVRQRSGDVREEFRPFMARLREFRARLDKPPASADTGLFGKELDDLTASGRRVLKTLESVSVALDEAEVELRATLSAKR